MKKQSKRKIELPRQFVAACGRLKLDPEIYALGILQSELETRVSFDGEPYVALNGVVAKKARISG